LITSVAFWARMQTELLDRQRWRTRLGLVNAIFEYIEGFYNRHRRHSALDWMSPRQFETITHLGPDLLTGRSVKRGQHQGVRTMGPRSSW
jgi:hypothetical protein